MGFITGVVTGIAAAAGAAAWYLSRSGSRVREQYRAEDRLADLGDEMDRRTLALRSTISGQLAEPLADDPDRRRLDAAPELLSDPDAETKLA